MYFVRSTRRRLFKRRSRVSRRRVSQAWACHCGKYASQKQAIVSVASKAARPSCHFLALRFDACWRVAALRYTPPCCHAALLSAAALSHQYVHAHERDARGPRIVFEHLAHGSCCDRDLPIPRPLGDGARVELSQQIITRRAVREAHDQDA